MIISLNGKWSFKQADSNEVLPAIVPGCNYTDLLRNGLISDPFYGTNESSVYWVSERDWVYFRDFIVDESALDSDETLLVFDSLDTIAEVFLNGIKVISAENYHLRYSVDVKGNLKAGNNHLEVRFFSPVNYVVDKQSHLKCPRNSNGLIGIPHIRKPQYHFGWDWGPKLAPVGISGNVYLRTAYGIRIDALKVSQAFEDDNVTLDIFAEFERFDKNVEITLSVLNPKGESIYDSLIVDTADGYIGKVYVNNPELWQTYEWTGRKQPLYTVILTASSGGVCVDKCKVKVGLRTIELNRNKDEYGSNFQFLLNGQLIFAKGADWIPPDSFRDRVSKEKLEFYISNAVKSGFNMLRVWGGGYYESDEFYELCDEYGLLVWQDFCFACQPYPFFIDDFKRNVLKEVEFNVKRLRNHPCLCLWCGNNEIEVMSAAWRGYRKFVSWTEKFFYDILPIELRKYDMQTPYIAGSPIGVAHNKGVSSDNDGDTHLWAVWHGLQNMRYYRTRNTRFCSEFGFESLPDIKCIKRFAGERTYSLTDEVFSAHQKCMSGNEKMEFYIASRFKIPKRFEDFIYLSQICQSECVRDATEYWRRNKGRCNGSLFWQYNDCWPVCSWASVDYFGNFKALQYNAKDFFKALTVSIDDSKNKIEVYVLNDLLQEKSVKVRMRLMNFFGETYIDESKSVVATANSIEDIKTFLMSDLKKCADLKSCVFVVDMFEDGKMTARKTLLFDLEKRIRLPETDIKCKIKVENGSAFYELSSSVFARAVMVQSKQSAPFSSNCFDLLPNESVTIIQNTECSQEELVKEFSVTDISHVEPLGSMLSDNIKRLCIALKPMNVLNWIYYKFII